MARVFISHAGVDTHWAEQVHRWLKNNKHDTYFDRDIDDGNLPGEEWQNRLYSELRQADAVLCIVTESYLTSVWCAAEIGATRVLGTELLPVRFAPGAVRHPLLTPIHDLSAIEDSTDAYELLARRLRVIDGGGGWGWPDCRSPYPGLRSFERDQHRVFFGRHHDITRIAERLRAPERATPAILTVVGPSGCGKSSLIRAGLLPRIAEDPHWLQLDPIVPDADPLDGLVRALTTLIQTRKIPFDVTGLRTTLTRDAVGPRHRPAGVGVPHSHRAVVAAGGGRTGPFPRVAFSPDGHRLATAGRVGDDTTVRLWNADTGAPVGTPVTVHTGWVADVVYSPSGLRLAGTGIDDTIRLWNADTGQPVGPALTGHEWVEHLAFSPDGHRLASASTDGTIRLWNADTGEAVGPALTGQNGVDQLAFSPDEHRLASASSDGTIQLWNADTGQPIEPKITGHTGSVWGVVFSPDGHRLASASDDTTVRLWNAETGQQIGEALKGPTDMRDVAFSPDGHRLLGASIDGGLWMWPADASPDMLCAKLTTNMSEKQWRDWVSDDPSLGYREQCRGLPRAPD